MILTQGELDQKREADVITIGVSSPWAIIARTGGAREIGGSGGMLPAMQFSSIPAFGAGAQNQEQAGSSGGSQCIERN